MDKTASFDIFVDQMKKSPLRRRRGRAAAPAAGRFAAAAAACVLGQRQRQRFFRVLCQCAYYGY